MPDAGKTVIPQTSDAQRELLEQPRPEAGSKLPESDLIAARTRLFGDRAREEARSEPARAEVRVLAPDVERRLRAGFDKNMATWDSFGLFSLERESRGYSKPTFEEYKAGFAKHIEFTKPGRPSELDKGYGVVSFVPMDVPLVSEDPERQTMFLMLERALKEEFARGGQQGKSANTLVVMTRRGMRMVQTEQRVNLNEILSAWKKDYLQGRVVHRPTALTKEGHGGFSGSELLAHGTDVERKNGGFMRLERSAIILPQDIGRETMSGHDWFGEKGRSIPKGVELQTVYDGIAFMIQFIKEYHYIPDAWTGKEETSQITFMPETFFAHQGWAGSVATANFYVASADSYPGSGQFALDIHNADLQNSCYGVRGGVRINEVS